jgi:hypothetical protein
MIYSMSLLFISFQLFAPLITMASIVVGEFGIVQLLGYVQTNCQTSTFDDFFISTKCEPIILKGVYQYQKAVCNQNLIANFLDANCNIPFSTFAPATCSSTSVLSKSITSTCKTYPYEGVVRLKYNYNFGCDVDNPAQTMLYPLGECINTTLFGTYDIASMKLNKVTNRQFNQTLFTQDDDEDFIEVNFFLDYNCNEDDGDNIQILTQKMKLGDCNYFLGGYWILESFYSNSSDNNNNQVVVPSVSPEAPTLTPTLINSINNRNMNTSYPAIIYFSGVVDLNENSTSLNMQIVGSSVGVLCGISALLVFISIFIEF